MSARYSVAQDTIRDTGKVVMESEGRFVLWQCPACTWFRVRTNTRQWEDTIIGHPNYGNVSNYDAFRKDIASHNCQATQAARIRHGFPLAPHTGPYTCREEVKT